MGFPSQGFWRRLPFSLSGNLPHPGIKPMSPVLAGDSLPLSHQGSPKYWGLFRFQILAREKDKAHYQKDNYSWLRIYQEQKGIMQNPKHLHHSYIRAWAKWSLPLGLNQPLKSSELVECVHQGGRFWQRTKGELTIFFFILLYFIDTVIKLANFILFKYL